MLLPLVVHAKWNRYKKFVIVSRPLTDVFALPRSDGPEVIHVRLERFFELVFRLFKSLAIVYGFSRLS